jgi:2-methylcitrate dehydratase PrpD
LAEFVTETRFGDIPPRTVQFEKELALKTTAAMLAGSITPAGRRILRYIRGSVRESPPQAGVFGCGFRASVEDAVLINGHFAHASELEDDQYPGCTSDVTIYPIVFPLAEWLKLSGREIMEAAFVGFEVQNRIAYYTYPRTEELGLMALSYIGVLGAAASASKLLGLDVEKTKSALGLAFTQAGGYPMNYGTDAHYFDSAWAGRNGLVAATMAREGMTSSGEIGTWLTNLMGKEHIKIDKIIEGLGKPPYFIHNVWIKKYPCCFETHRIVDALLILIREHKLSSQDITSVEVHAGPIDATCDRPEPKDTEDSKFSFQHVLAGIMLEGDIGMDTFTDEKLKDPKFREARAKVKVITHTEWPNEELSGVGRVTATLRNGRSLTKEMKQSIGGTELPLTTEDVVALYRKYAGMVLSEKQTERTKDMIMQLDKANDVMELMDILTYRHAARI